MKKILFLLIILISLYNCSPTRSNSDDPKSDSLRKYLPALIIDIGLANREALKTLISMPNQILKTGQSQSYISGDDGAYLSGADRSFVKGGRDGLLWQRCSSGQKNDDSCSGKAKLRSWKGARDYCRNLWLGGLEWRLPTVQELNTLIDYGKSNSLIDSNVFPNTQSEYWASNIYLKAGVKAYLVQFKSSESIIVDLAKIGETVQGTADYYYDYYSGYTYTAPSGYDRCDEDYYSESYFRCYDTAYVKCVSGKSSLSSSDYSDKRDGTIEDKNSDLTWQKCTAGLNSSSGTCSSGSPSSLTWTSAIAYCEGLTLEGKSDWRLPNVNELVGLLDLSVLSIPLIDSVKFPNTYTASYWTSSTHPVDTTSAIEVSFSNGILGLRSKNSSRYVRCVR
jgi:hypothetical protein